MYKCLTAFTRLPTPGSQDKTLCLALFNQKEDALQNRLPTSADRAARDSISGPEYQSLNSCSTTYWLCDFG